jgi:hypothetical protein
MMWIQMINYHIQGHRLNYFSIMKCYNYKLTLLKGQMNFNLKRKKFLKWITNKDYYRTNIHKPILMYLQGKYSVQYSNLTNFKIDSKKINFMTISIECIEDIVNTLDISMKSTKKCYRRMCYWWPEHNTTQLSTDQFPCKPSYKLSQLNSSCNSNLVLSTALDILDLRSFNTNFH